MPARAMRTSDAMLASEVRAISWRGTPERVSRASLRLRTVVAVLVALGTALRLGYYIVNPALSSDEAALALNLMHRSYSGLFHQLDVNQAAPPGFLLVQKLAIDVLGPSPYVLRLFPLLGSLGALLLFFPVASRLVERRTALVGLSLFAISDPLLTYAGTNKPYSTDVLATLGLYAILLVLPNPLGLRGSGDLTLRGSAILTVAGAVAVWFSYASAFVVTVILAVVLIELATSRNWVHFARVLVPIVLVAGSFAAAYFVTHSSVANLQRAFGESPPGLFGDNSGPGLLQTYGGIARYLFAIPDLNHAVRASIAALGVALALIGTVRLARTRLRVTTVLVVPGLLALIAGSTSKYALYPRTFLFLIPALVLLTARGALHVISRRRLSAIGAGSVALAIVVTSASYATVDRFRSTRQADAAKALRYLARNAHPGDALYVHVSAQLDFRYYLECGCFGPDGLVRKARSLWPIRGSISDRPFFRTVPPDLAAGGTTAAVPSFYKSELALFHGRSRVWVLVMDPAASAQTALRHALFEMGQEKDVYPRSGPTATAWVALFDLG